MAKKRTKKQGKLTDAQVRFFVFKAVLVFCFCSLSFKILELGLDQSREPKAVSGYAQNTFVERGIIYDRNGVELALSLDVLSLYADPKMMMDHDDAIASLKLLFPDLKWEKIESRIKSPKRRFVWLKRKLTPKEVKSVYHLGIPGLGFKKEKVRFYPHENLYAHMLGGVNNAGEGAFGLEYYQNQKLSKGEDLTLTIDSRLQSRLHKTLEGVMQQEGTFAAWGVALDAKTREVLAAVSMPDYDPNALSAASENVLRNRFAQGVYEMGSTFKVFTLAQGYELGVIDDESKIDARKPIKISRFTIKDSHAKKMIMTPGEVLKYSSNIGASRISDLIEVDAFKDFYGQLSFLSPMDYGFGATSSPLYPQRKWGRIHKMTMSFGHGIAIAPLQLLAGFSAVVTDGEVKQPKFFKGAPEEEFAYQVVSGKTTEKMKRLLNEVTITGTARLSKVAGFNVGGKTGTAEISVAGGYNEDHRVSSYIGAIPIEDPELIVLIMVDESQKIGGGGRIAAPAFAEFVKGSVPILGMRPKLENEWRLLDRNGKNEYAGHAERAVAGL